MTSKRKTPEFDITDDYTPTTSDGDCPCIALGRKDRQCPIHCEV